MNLEEAVQKLHASRQRLLQAIAITPLEQMDAPVEGEWSTRDLIGHVAAWETTLIAPLCGLADGRPYQVEIVTDGQAWNMQHAAARKSFSLDQLLDELASVRAGLIKAAQSLSPEQLEQRYPAPWGGELTPVEMLAGLAWHEDEHAHSLQPAPSV